MANTDRAAGFKPVGHLNGNPWSGKARMYYVPATDTTALFIGDAVKSAGSADSTGKYPTVTRAAAGDTLRGVVVGFGDQPYVAVDTTNQDRRYRPASTAMYALVVDDPDVIFEVQEDSDGVSLTADEVGLSTNIVAGAGNTSTGLSGMELDSSDTATDTAGQCKILRAVDRVDNDLGTKCKWEVLLIEHELRTSLDV